MEDIFTEENVQISVNALLEKNDSCGIDGIFVSKFKEYWDLNKEKILDSLRSGTYKPDAVQQSDCLKKNGRKRKISRYTCTDRVVLDVLKRYLTPLWEPEFSGYSFAYQENKGVQTAVRQAARFIEEGNIWVVELDVQDFFDNINLERLESMLRKKNTDESLMRLIHQYLYILVEEDYQKIRKMVGLVQGSPISPLLSNVYMDGFDKFLEQKYKFCRFSDDINLYCDSEEHAMAAAKEVTGYLKNRLGLTCHTDKGGVYPALTRRYLGYEFFKTGKSRKLYIRKAKKEQESYYKYWHTSAIQRIDRNYHLVNDGILTKKDFTILFENEEKKYYIPVEICGSINVYSNVTFSTSFLECMNRKRLNVNVFNRYGEYLGGFCSAAHYESGKTLLKQAQIYNDEKKRLAIAKSIELASLHNQRENLRYYNKHRKSEELQAAIKHMTDCMTEMKVCTDLEKLMLVEARAKQKYLQSFDAMVNDENFRFEKRTRRPPQNPLNAMISFGNVFLYRRIATEIYKTSLDIRIGFVHATNNRSESLNLDLAEIFKPIIVDRAIFTVIHNMEINAKEHFEREESGGIYLNKEGKRIFIRELERKLYQKLTVSGKAMTYDTLIRNEIRKVVNLVQRDEKYKPFKYT